ncbi:hypothetical protein INT43_002412 [Umbelopsis isabellina]|uniref:HCP-like protein n=1 Tax=Mortierella isabellina TaxID=91625 RepID=A0A8H7Q6H3_MORIS|nr:hypothetical protein INT43_002412 [Umbelopsis isabellina]
MADIVASEHPTDPHMLPTMGSVDHPSSLNNQADQSDPARQLSLDRLTLESNQPSPQSARNPSPSFADKPTAYTDSPYVQKPDVVDSPSSSSLDGRPPSSSAASSESTPEPIKPALPVPGAGPPPGHLQAYNPHQPPYRGHSPYSMHADLQRGNTYRPSPVMAPAPRPMYNGEGMNGHPYQTPQMAPQGLAPQQPQMYWDEYSQQYVPQPYNGYNQQDYYRQQQMYQDPYAQAPYDEYMMQQQQQQQQQMQQQQMQQPINNEVLPPIGKRPGKKSEFPPPTLDNLSRFRSEARGTNDPMVQLKFAKFLVEAIPQVCTEDPDQKRARKIREGMANEAQRIVKKLAASSSIGKTTHSEAQFFLGNCYGSGTMGLSVDHDKAFNCYVQASKQSHPAATYRTAVCYEVGAGTKRDHARSILFYRKAANLGDTPAMYKLGMILLKGFLSQQKNPREGISWLKRAAANADEENPHALHELGLAYEKEGIPSVIADEKYARELFTQAAQYGYAPSQFKLGCCYEYGQLTCPVDPRRSIAWYSRAAEQGDVEAELALSGWYLTGSEGVLKQSDTEAYLWARKAADKGYAKAEYAVGYYTETGIGLKPEFDEARRWYMRSAAQGNKRAMQRLTELKKYGNARPQQRQKHTRAANGAPRKQDSDCSIM